MDQTFPDYLMQQEVSPASLKARNEETLWLMIYYRLLKKLKMKND